MTATLAHNGYQSARSTLDERAIEFQVFSQITARLDYYRDKRELIDGSYSKFLEALYDNQRLWDSITVDIALPNHPYPLDLKQKLFSLAHFVRTYTSKILGNNADMTILIEINQSIMAGLKGQHTQEGDGNGRP